jgi:hypothetical protein
MFIHKKLTIFEIEDLKINANHLSIFATELHSYFNMLKKTLETTDESHSLLSSALKNEIGSLQFYINETLDPVIKRGNKLLSKYKIDEMTYNKDTTQTLENCPEFCLIKYYLGLSNIKGSINHLKLIRIKGFDFFDKLNEINIKSIGEKIQSLSYYYVVDNEEKKEINRVFNNYKEKSFYSKINKLHNEYLLDKITGFSFNTDDKLETYDFNFDVDNFKDVLNRIKNKENNVISFNK